MLTCFSWLHICKLLSISRSKRTTRGWSRAGRHLQNYNWPLARRSRVLHHRCRQQLRVVLVSWRHLSHLQLRTMCAWRSVACRRSQRHQLRNLISIRHWRNSIWIVLFGYGTTQKRVLDDEQCRRDQPTLWRLWRSPGSHWWGSWVQVGHPLSSHRTCASSCAPLERPKVLKVLSWGSNFDCETGFWYRIRLPRLTFARHLDSAHTSLYRFFGALYLKLLMSVSMVCESIEYLRRSQLMDGRSCAKNCPWRGFQFLRLLFDYCCSRWRMRLRSLVCISRLKNGLQLLLRCSLDYWIYRIIHRSMLKTLFLLSF